MLTMANQKKSCTDRVAFHILEESFTQDLPGATLLHWRYLLTRAIIMIMALAFEQEVLQLFLLQSWLTNWFKVDKIADLNEKRS